MLSAGGEATCCRPFQPADNMSACRQRAACTRSWSRPRYSKFHTPKRARVQVLSTKLPLAMPFRASPGVSKLATAHSAF